MRFIDVLVASINHWLSLTFPGLGKPKRLLLAYLAKFQDIHQSYSQIGEDQIAIKILNEMKIVGPFFYIDIGANHPTRLSNTYRMYREGSKGIAIEPNAELLSLHKRIRPRDIQLGIGCGKNNELLKFYYSKTPVLSSFSKLEVKELWGTDFLPVFKLDKICEDLSIKRIDFLSIDVEGFDIEALEGSLNALKFTRLVCIEANSVAIEKIIIKFMVASGFQLKLKNEWNLFFSNSDALLK
jgi:FkbM family methyltransferase